MVMQSSNNSRPGHQRVRATRACKVCNARRVRCNVMEMQPCFNCTSSNVPCELVQSKRGRYPRTQKTRTASSAAEAERPAMPTSSSCACSNASTTALPAPNCSTPMLVADGSSRRTSSIVTSTVSSQRSDSARYYGESCPLTCICGTSKGPRPDGTLSHANRHKMYYIALDDLEGNADGADRKRSLADFLVKEGAFTFPEPVAHQPILEAYFSHFHPCFPVIDQSDLAYQYSSGTLSPLLFNSILFIGSIYCEEQSIQSLGYKGRAEAKSHFYHCAKLLFEADWESNTVTVLQALFLLSFWRAPQSKMKNVRYWLGAAISLAQDHGFHRSTRISTTETRTARIRKRIWWSLYVRERQSSSALGLPSRIHDEECDVEMLTAADLSDEPEVDLPWFMGSTELENLMYPIKMASLAVISGKVVDHLYTRCQPAIDKASRPDLEEALERWKADLLPDHGGEEQDEKLNNFMRLLQLAYNHLLILLHRHALVKPRVGPNVREAQIAVQAACRISRIVEDTLSLGTIQFSQMHSITACFAAMCVHTHEFQRSKGTVRRLAENRAKFCLLGLKELQKHWKINNSILDLFLKHVDQTVKNRLRDEEEQQSGQPNGQQADESPTLDFGSEMFSNPQDISEYPKFDSIQQQQFLNVEERVNNGDSPTQVTLSTLRGGDFNNDLLSFLTSNPSFNNDMWVEDFELLQSRL